MSDRDLLKGLEELERELHRPSTRTSETRLRELLHRDFVEIGRSGSRYSLASILERLAAGDPPEVHAQDFELVFSGTGVALVTCRSAHVAEGGDLQRHTRRSSLWKRQREGWRLLFHQATPIGFFAAVDG